MHKLKNNAVNEKTMKNLRNRIDIRLINNNNKKDYLKWTLKPSYVSQNIFDDDLVRKSKVTLKLNKQHTLRCVLHLSKVVMYEFHYD